MNGQEDATHLAASLGAKQAEYVLGVYQCLTQDGDRYPGESALGWLVTFSGRPAVSMRTAPWEGLAAGDLLLLLYLDLYSPVIKEDPALGVVVSPAYWQRRFEQIAAEEGVDGPPRTAIVASLLRLFALDYLKPVPGVAWWAFFHRPRSEPYFRHRRLRNSRHSSFPSRRSRRLFMGQAEAHCALCSAPRRRQSHHRYARRPAIPPLCDRCNRLLYGRLSARTMAVESTGREEP